MLSAVILTKNEENKIAALIKSLKFAKEIIVIDDYSLDNTVSIAKKNGAIVFKHHLNEDFAAQRNYALRKAKFKWVFFVDADEFVSEALAREIVKKVNENLYSGFYLKRKGRFMGRQMKWGEWSNSQILPKFGHNKLLRLAKKDCGRWVRPVHEYWDVKGPVGELTNSLIHESDKNLKEIISSLNFQARLHSVANKKEGKKANIFKIVFYPPLKFAVNYLCKMGFRDGTHGFIHASLMSFHSFLAWSQLYLNQKQK